MQRLHKAYPVTGTVATGAAARLPGTIVHEVCHDQPALESVNGGEVSIGHPSGQITIDIVLSLPADGSTSGPTLERAVLVRTARRLMDGTAYVPGGM